MRKEFFLRARSNMILGLALTLGMAYGFAADEKKAPATPVGATAISAQADADCDKAKADCPKGSAACAKAHAKGAKHSAADCPKGPDGLEHGQCEKHKAGEAKAVPGKTGEAKPDAKPADVAKTGSQQG